MVYVSCSVFIWVEKNVFGYRILTHHEIEKHFYARTFMLLFYVMTHRARWVTPLLAYIHNNNNCATCKSLWVKFSHCATQAESNTSFKAGALGRSAVIETPYESMYVHFGYGEIFSDNWSPVMEKFIQTLGMHSMRNLSMRGKAVICNVMATSKLTYVGQFLHLPEQFLKLINKELFSFIHGTYAESIKRETLYGDPSVGGIGLVCIKLKLRASLIMHIVRLLTYNEEYVPKWVHFARYWVGLHYRQFCPDFASNMKLHSLEYTPRFYKQCQLLFDDYIKDFGDNVNLKSLSLKIVYQNMLSKVFIPPLIVSKFPEKDFSSVWGAVNDNFLDPEIRAFAYRMAHNVLPTNHRLFIHGSSKNSDCTFCGKKFVETPKHLFAECRQAAPVWFFVKSVFWKMCNHRLKVDEDLDMFSLLPKLPVDKAVQRVLFYITCLARYSIWATRCIVKKQFRHFSGNSSLEDFKKKLKFRILIDSQRYKNDRRIFLQSWAIDDVLCSMDVQGCLTYHF